MCLVKGDIMDFYDPNKEFDHSAQYGQIGFRPSRKSDSRSQPECPEVRDPEADADRLNLREYSYSFQNV